MNMSMRRHPNLALGTVQFGLAYGIAGRDAPVPEDEARAILAHAVDCGVDTLDTAAAYGDIEPRLARLVDRLPLKVISKVPAIPAHLTPEEAAQFATDSAEQSLQRLGDLLRGLMLHQASDLHGERGHAVMAGLRPWAARHGIILGVSGYGAADIGPCRKHHGIELAQLPGNALDQRITSPDAVAALQGMEIHLRSALLQGLLLMPLSEACIKLPPATTALQQWHAFCAQTGQSPLVAALSLAKSFEVVSSVVLGVDSLQQWQAITTAWQLAAAHMAPQLAVDAQSPIIDPRQWRSLA